MKRPSAAYCAASSPPWLLAACIGAQRRRDRIGGRAGLRRQGRADSKISIQLWTFAEYIGFGTDAATIERTRRSSAGSARWATATSSRSAERPRAEEYRALLDKYGLKASARHVDIGRPEDPADIEQIIADNKTLGIKYFGSGSTPIFPRSSTRPRRSGSPTRSTSMRSGAGAQGGPAAVRPQPPHRVPQTFGGQTVFDILMANTDPRNVVFQLDLYWADNGGVDPIDVIEQYGNRIQLFHVKDAAEDGPIEIVGEGTIDFPSIFAAAGGSTRYYVVEHDPRFGDPTFDPFEAAEKGFDYLDCVTF